MAAQAPTPSPDTPCARGLLSSERVIDALYAMVSDGTSRCRVRQMAVPSEWSGTPPGQALPAPRPGRHSREVLREAGNEAQRIAALFARGAARE